MKPILETERLILRKPVESDFEQEIAFWQSPRAKTIGGLKTREDVWRAHAMLQGHWHFRGYGFFALIEKATNTYIGRVGPWYPEGWPEIEMSWTITSPKHEGKSFAFEAAKAALKYSFTKLGIPTIISLIEPKNVRSIALAQRLGACADGEFFMPNHGTHTIFRHNPISEHS